MANTTTRLGPLSPAAAGGGGGSSAGFVFNFIIDTWVVDVSDYSITVALVTHSKGLAPAVQVYELEGAEYKLVIVQTEVSDLGEVKIKVPQIPDNRFVGKIIIS